MQQIKVKIKLTRNMSLPQYQTSGSAAVDLCAALEVGESLTLRAGERVSVPTGVAISPETDGVVAVVAARSGLAVKKGITLSNGIGVIDSDYRGEIFVGLHNISDTDFTIERGDRIAQLMFMPVCSALFDVTDELDNTERGSGGFGSTGIK